MNARTLHHARAMRLASIVFLIGLLIAGLMASAAVGRFGAMAQDQNENIVDDDDEHMDTARRFVPIHIFIDPRGRALAAWQIEFKAPANVSIVGIGNGEHPAYAAEPPHYDHAAMMMNRRVILAQYSLGGEAGADALPSERVRIATIDLLVEGAIKADQIVIEVIAAAQVGGERIDVEVSIQIGDES